VSPLTNGDVRVLIYSSNNSIIEIGSGALLNLKFKSKTLPGNFTFSLLNITLSSATGTNITSSSQSGTVKVLGPHLTLSKSNIDFGKTVLNSSPTAYLEVKNIGNESLIVTDAVIVSPFSILESFPITINANSSQILTLKLDTSVKTNVMKELTFTNNDPDILRNTLKVELKADVYVTNEIRIGSNSGEKNSEVAIPVNIDNMESFTGFQFDIQLPEGIEYIVNSITTSARFKDHEISANLLSGNKLRVLAFSSKNEIFNGTSGEVFNFKVKPTISSGSHALIISNAILSNSTEGNILTGSYSGNLQINAANLLIEPLSISFGNVPITENKETIFRLYNNGNAQLIIDSTANLSDELSIDLTVPITIEKGTYKEVKLSLKPKMTGAFSKIVSFKHNSPELENFIDVSANVYSPNYVTLRSQNASANQTNKILLFLRNNDQVTATQFDLLLPIGFDINIDELNTTSRIPSFSVSGTKISENTYRIILYSMSNTIIEKGDGSILEMPVFVQNNVVIGTYNAVFSNVIISNSNNSNVNSVSSEISSITVILDSDQDGIADGIDQCPNTVSGETPDANGCSANQLDIEEFIVDEERFVYPNPTSGLITIMIPGTDRNVLISITNTSGLLIHQQINELLSSRRVSTDLSRLPTGTYFITTTSDTLQKTFKIIKK
jgi:hypothetical protein